MSDVPKPLGGLHLMLIVLLGALSVSAGASLAAPFFSGNYTQPAFPATYNYSGSFSFQVNVTDALNSSVNITQVGFTLYRNGTSPLIYATGFGSPILNISSRVYYINLTQSDFGSAGQYAYIWSANNSTGSPNNTANVTLTINKASLSDYLGVLVDNFPNDTTVAYNATTRQVAGLFNSSGAGDITFALFNYTSQKDFSSNTNLTLDLGVGTYSFVYGTVNGTSANYIVGNSTVRNLTITKGNLASFLNVTVNGVIGNSTAQYPSLSYLSGSYPGGASDIPFMLFNASSGLSINSTQFVSIVRSVGTYLSTFGTNVTSSQNWTISNSSVQNLTITKGNLTNYLDILLDNAPTPVNSTGVGAGNFPANGNNVSGRFNSTGASDIVFSLFDASTNTNIDQENGVFVNRTVGNHVFIYGTTNSTASNWTTSNTTNRTIVINKGVFYLKLAINGVQSTQSMTYSKNIPIAFWSSADSSLNVTPSGSSDIYVGLYRDNQTLLANSSILNATYVQQSSLPDGSYRFSLNATSGQNWTANFNSYHDLTIDRATPNITILLDGSPVSRSYIRGDVINITAVSDAFDDVSPWMRIFTNFTNATVSIGNTSGFSVLYNLTDTTDIPAGTYAVSANITNPTQNYTNSSNSSAIYITLADSVGGGSQGSSGSSVSGGGTSSSWSSGQTQAPITSTSGEQSISIPVIDPSKPVNYSISDSMVPVTSLSISSNQIVRGVQISVRAVSQRDIIVRLDRKVFSYIDVEKVNITNDQISGANVGFRVNRSWLRDNNASEGDVYLYRFSSGWNRLETNVTGEDSGYAYYQSASPGFSTFAIAIEPNAPKIAQKEESVVSTAAQNFDWKPWVVTGLLLAVLASAFAVNRAGRRK